MEWKRPFEGPSWKVKSSTEHRKELMLTCFWDAHGIINVDFLEKGYNMNGAYYGDLLRQTRHLRRKSKGVPLWLAQDNAPVHKSLVAQKAIEESGFEALLHPLYSPDLAPSDFKLFNALKSAIRGQKFESQNDLKEFVQDWFHELPPNFCHDAFRELIVRWNKCVEVDGQWFEK